MQSLQMSLRSLARDWRGGELSVLVAALVIAVAAISAVGFATSRVERAMRQEAASALAADVAIRARHALPAAHAELARELGLETARLLSFPSVINAGERVQLAEIRAADEAYPLRGRVRIAAQPFGPARALRAVPPPGEAWLAPRLMAALEVAVGDRVKVGRKELRVGAALASLPDQGLGFADLAPAALLNLADIEATGLVGPGSRVRYRLLAAGPPAQVERFIAALKPRLGRGEDILTLDDTNDGLTDAVARADRFLALAALTAVLLAGAAVALAARQYARRETDAVAVLKALGMRRRGVLGLYALRLLWLGLGAGLLGLVLGYAAHALLMEWVSSLFERSLPPPTFTGPALAALGTTLILLAGFALPPVAALVRTPPARVLRRELGPQPPSTWLLYGLALAAALALTFWRLDDAELALATLGGLTGGVLLLAAGAWLLVRLLGRLRGHAGTAGRFGLANIARRGTESIAQAVAFGLGLMVLLLLGLVRGDLLEGWRATLPPDAPNHFFINIQSDQRSAVREFFVRHGRSAPELAPLVRARLTAVNGVPVTELDYRDGRREWFVEREQNLSWAAAKPESNTLVAGEWWSGTPASPEVSVEAEVARDMGFELGDRLSFSVADQEITAEITSIREIAWDSFEPNFFLVFSPGALDGLPATWITSAYVPPERGALLVQFLREFPSVTVFDLEAILNQIRTLMDQASRAVEFVFGFTLAAGVAVLLAAVQATRRERRFESALLRALGGSRRLVFTGVLAEFLLLGLLAGTLAAAGASFTGWLLAREVFEIEWQLNPWLWPLAVGGGMLLVGGAGLAATWRVVGQSPMQVLRRTA